MKVLPEYPHVYAFDSEWEVPDRGKRVQKIYLLQLSTDKIALLIWLPHLMRESCENSMPKRLKDILQQDAARLFVAGKQAPKRNLLASDTVGLVLLYTKSSGKVCAEGFLCNDTDDITGWTMKHSDSTRSWNFVAASRQHHVK
ncbi:hypothetical protein SARC_00618 [Sphaeroforma arctica JP610]|uniref:Uncharacterized protein n=1 Tax=Sphaeroforma arctica JP610 TaxID=667725 RepID=A0A0L0GEI0_9EUKA|nr:hypothetical protein SARC_00618 [Sphaeroforma arctica JP610]KNC87291.1 hypothetical protein SARC_00618 [Sphaeroforma arctica JP610]|eukprot:XP_014161193.1 hypothetical protein SARC_00618 [Sphaeroforma arctica JP610]